MQEIVVYGIESCDQVRKARSWLRSHGVAHRLHDFRRDGLDPQRLAAWLVRMPWDALLNRRGLAWRKLDLAQRQSVTDQGSAIELMLAHPLLIKRPVIEHDQGILVGFSEPVYASLFAGTA